MLPIETKIVEMTTRIDAIESRASAIIAAETATDETDAELRALASEKHSLLEKRAATKAFLPVPVETSQAAPVDAEQRAFEALRSKVSVARYLHAGQKGNRVSGVEEEFRQAVNADERSIPFLAFETPVEDRADAVSASPGTAGSTAAPIVPAVFSQSVAMSIGASIVRVPSGPYVLPRITTSLTAGAVAKGADRDSEAAVLTLTTAVPRRISARLSTTAEDAASVGSEDFESALRTNLQMVLADAIDSAILVGSGVAPNISGVMTDLAAAVAAGSSAATFLSATKGFSSLVDGKHAANLRELGLVCSPELYAFLASLFNTSGSDMSVVNWIELAGGRVLANAQMPATASTISTGLALRTGRGVSAMIPSWGDIAIEDIYSGSASATKHVSLHVLLGDPLIPNPATYGGFAQKIS